MDSARTETLKTDTTPEDEIRADGPVLPRSRRKRHWWLPKFRMMDLIWLALLAAVLMSWNRDHQKLSEINETLRTGMSSSGVSWSVTQILGPPNTPGAGDYSTAWAPLSQDSSREWVIVEFRNSVEVQKVAIWETYNPGAVDRICSVNAANLETEIWKGTDPTSTSAAMGTSSIPIRPGVTSRRLKIYLNSPAVRGWNEIDAVALHGKDGSVQWASNAWASSAFGKNNEAPKWFWP
jgi:hypothetical protein